MKYLLTTFNFFLYFQSVLVCFESGIHLYRMESCLLDILDTHTVKWGNFGRWGNFGQYKTFILSNFFCRLENNLVVNMEVKGYLQSIICFERSFIRLEPMMS